MAQIEDIRQYLGNTRFVWWFVYGGDRLAVMASLLGVAFVIYFLLGSLNIFFLPGNRLMWLLNGLVNGLLSLVTIVLAVNQLVLSEQFGSVGDLYDRLEQILDFREIVGEMTGTDVTPVQPGEFFAGLLTALGERAAELDGAASDCEDEQLTDEIGEYTTDLEGQTSRIRDEVEGANGFSVLLFILDYNDSRQFYTARRLQAAYADSLTEPTETALSEIQELLKEIDTTRQYFKTVYLQRELSQLSRMTVYTGIIATIVAGVTILTYRDVTTATLDPTLYYILLSGALVLTQSPLAVLFSYAVRAATISRKTAAFGPFIPEEEQEQVSGQGGF
ncbi:MAG TPA: hypothetical protein VFJ06_11965 [Halococcus sp.]|nr:hypothetical protein [Halococcus sp.]